MKNRQYRSNQGRSPEKQRVNEIVMMITIVGMILTMGILVIMESI
ncbi:hypothetical protein N9923_00080 [bacterium]|nr:hypothetical protein [bacterium]